MSYTVVILFVPCVIQNYLQDFLQGDPAKAMKELGWKPEVTFMVCILFVNCSNTEIWKIMMTMQCPKLACVVFLILP